jgi:SAM-dependent methyltransferase
VEEHAYRDQFRLEDSHWWFAGRRAVIWALLRRAGMPTSARLLDAGCGTGRNLIEFAGLGVAQGVDFSSEAIELCRRRGVESVRQASLDALPFGDAAFDLILATDVLEHLADDLAAMRELRRVAAPGARLLATVPAYRWLWSEHDVEHQHFRRYTLRRLVARLRASGWEPQIQTYFNTTLLAPIAAVRLLSRIRGETAGDRAQPDLELTPPGLNRVLEQPMRLEAALIARGGRLPAGVSIGVVCAAGRAA